MTAARKMENIRQYSVIMLQLLQRQLWVFLLMWVNYLYPCQYFFLFYSLIGPFIIYVFVDSGSYLLLENKIKMEGLIELIYVNRVNLC